MRKLGSGCGPGKLGDLIIPDYPFGSCCKTHDLDYDNIVDKLEAYYHGNFINFVTSQRPQEMYNKVLKIIVVKSHEYKQVADDTFYKNMLAIAKEMNVFVRWWYKRKARIYYEVVKLNNNYVYQLFLKRLGGVK